MATSRWSTVADAVLAALRANTGYRDPATVGGTGIPVFDGPQLTLVSERPLSYLCIGWSGEDGDDDAGEFEIEGETLGYARMRETGRIRCLAVTQSGTTSPVTARTAAFGVLGDVETELRGTFLTNLVLWAHVTAGRPRQYAPDGTVCWIDFDITYRARI